MTEMNSARLRYAFAAAFMFAATGIVGCGDRSDLGTVSGRVTSGGQPVSGLEVRSDPQGPGRKSVGYTDENGEFELLFTPTVNGALVGKHNVAVIDRSGKTTIPSEFSSMEFEVEPGSNRLDIDIPAQ